MSKKYKITVSFEVEDTKDFDIERHIRKKGIEEVQDYFAQGFSDAEFENVKCKVEKK